MMYQAGWMGDLILWFIIFTVVVWILLYSLRPSIVKDKQTDNIDGGKLLIVSLFLGVVLVMLLWLFRIITRCNYRSTIGSIFLWFLVFTVIIWLLYYSIEPQWILTSSGNIDYSRILWSAVITSIVIIAIAILLKIIVFGKSSIKH